MSSSSSSGYDVFLSFRGTDTRKTFTSHLHKALVDRGIVTFKDDVKIQTGEPFPHRILQSIKDAIFAVIVISENFTSSKWCLIELRSIMELWSKGKIRVFPIFYGVEPSDLRNEKGRFLKPLKRHRRNPFAAEVPKWKEALSEVSYLNGKEPTKFKDDAAMIEDIVSEISDELSHMLPIHSEDVFGMNSHMVRLDSMLNMRSEEEVCMIGIWGMGGVGKTTIAKNLFNRYSREFSASCFIEDVWKFSRTYGLMGLQEMFISSILPKEHVRISMVDQGRHHIKSRLGHQRVFVVLDGVETKDHIEALAREKSMFGRGSRIIITTRDKSLFRTCGFTQGDLLYKVHCLESDDSLLMFKRFAFEGGSPPSDSYEQLSVRAAELAHGLPFALEALGLCFRGKTTTFEWEDELRRLNTTPHENTVEILKISYNNLHEIEKNVFLHVACLFNGESIMRVRALLDNFESGIKLLSEKSLVNISTDGYLEMHALVEQTGRQIVRQKSNQRPQNQLILWDPEEICNVLRHKSGTDELQCLALHICKMKRELAISCSNFRPIYNLKLLKFYKHLDDLESNLQFVSEDHLSPPDLKLKLLHWDAYPLTTLPFNLRLECLVEVNLRYSNLESLWDGTPELGNLRRLDVTGSVNLRELPDFSNASELQDLVMDGCMRLEQFPRYLGSLSSLGTLYASHCDGLRSLHINIRLATTLQEQSVSPCPLILLEFLSELKPLQSLANLSIHGKIKLCLGQLEGDADHFSFNLERKIPFQLMMKPQPPCFASNCRDVKCLEIKRNNYNEDFPPFESRGFSDFPLLTELSLINLKMNNIPSSIDELHALEKLSLSGNDFEYLPRTMEKLSRLKYLDLQNCCKLKALPPLNQVETLILSDCINLRSLLELPDVLEDQRLYCLLELNLDNCNNVQSLSDQLNHFINLIQLDLSRHDFETIPASIKELFSLNTLNLKNCKKLQSLEDLPLSLKFLCVCGCCALEDVSILPDTHPVTQFPTNRSSEEVPSECGSLQESEIPSSICDDEISRWSLPFRLPRINPSLTLLGSVTCFMLFFIGKNGLQPHQLSASETKRPKFSTPSSSCRGAWSLSKVAGERRKKNLERR